MDFLIALVLLVIGFVFLVKGSDWFVDGTASLAARLGIPQIVIGLTIVAMGTSAPEAAVSISAAFAGSADISIANVVGSNMLNILIILGISSVITTLAVKKTVVWIDIPFTVFISAVLLVMGLFKKLNWISAVILLVLFISYLTYLFIHAKKNPVENCEEFCAILTVPKAILFTLIGLALIILGSRFAVDGATTIARLIGISERFIGLTIVALGTSLPELFTSVSAARKGNADIAIGNIVGSNIFNILFILGLSSLIIPINFAPELLIDTAVSGLAAVLLFICCAKEKKLTRAHGVIMLICYGVYFAYLCIK